MKCRAYELERGYLVEIYGRPAAVTTIKDGRIYLRYFHSNAKYGAFQTISSKNQMWVKIIGYRELNWKKMRVAKYTLDGVRIDTYSSLTLAAKENKAWRHKISECIHGVIKHHKGFVWKKA